jgi:hypothetical protein
MDTLRMLIGVAAEIAEECYSVPDDIAAPVRSSEGAHRLRGTGWTMTGGGMMLVVLSGV